MVPLDAGIASLGNWKQLGFVAPDAKAMMDRLSAVGFGPFKVYRVDSGDWEGVNYRGAPAERYALEVCMATGTRRPRQSRAPGELPGRSPRRRGTRRTGAGGIA